jgi:hypothetical protein
MTLLLVLGACYLGFLGGLWLAGLCAATQVAESQRLCAELQQAIEDLEEPAGPSTYMRQYRVVDRVLLEQAWAICDREDLDRVLTREETAAIDRAVGLR